MISCFALNGVLILAGHAAVEYGKRFGTKVFAELEVFKETEAVRLIIIGVETVVELILPAVEVQWTILNGAYRMLPLITIGEIGAFDDATAWEAEDAGMQVIERLGKILTHATGTIFPRLGREEAHMLKVKAWAIDCILRFAEFAVAQEDTEHAILAGGKWGEIHFVLFPFVAFDSYLG